jgi:SAM-dependent methyltransferase
MSRPLSAALDDVRSAVLDDTVLRRAVGSGRRRGERPPWRRVELRYVRLKAGLRLQVTTYDDRQAHTRNVEPGPAAEHAVDELLALPFGNWHVDTTDATLQMRVTKKGDALLHRRRRDADEGRSAAHSEGQRHDRVKARLLDPGDPVLHAIGITDHEGRVKPSRNAKYRQVEEFLRILASVVDSALESGRLRTPTAQAPLRIVDLGCGNAYLSFAAFGYLSRTRGMPVRMMGVDVRPASRQRNAELAGELGFEDELTFVEGAIADAQTEQAPDVVLALHACDTATDEALARAVRWRAPLLLAAPCCHHDLQQQLRGGSAPSPYRLVVQHGILRERMADVLTDTIRAALLRQHGYRVDVVEFVDSVHTPRNVLLRAVHTGAPAGPEAEQEYADLVAAWGVRPALARMLSG